MKRSGNFLKRADRPLPSLVELLLLARSDLPSDLLVADSSGVLAVERQNLQRSFDGHGGRAVGRGVHLQRSAAGRSRTSLVLTFSGHSPYREFTLPFECGTLWLRGGQDPKLYGVSAAIDLTTLRRES